jgi:hypothetical protein
MTVAPRPFDDFSNRATRATVSVVCRPNSVPLITTAHQVCRLVSSSQIRLSPHAHPLDCGKSASLWIKRA